MGGGESPPGDSCTRIGRTASFLAGAVAQAPAPAVTPGVYGVRGCVWMWLPSLESLCLRNTEHVAQFLEG